MKVMIRIRSPRARCELLEEKWEADRNKYIAVFEGDPTIEVLNGRYGLVHQVWKDQL